MQSMNKLNRFFVSVLIAGVAGCGGDSESFTPDAGATDASVVADANCGEAPSCATWIQDYEREVVSKLSGHSEISPGVTLQSRFTIAQRDASRSYIADELSKMGLTVELHNYGTGTNVFVRLSATEPEASVILLGSHFDGIDNSPAAGDDGTGVALVLAAARYFASTSVRENEIIFAFFDQEELGLIGSQAFAEKMRMEVPLLAAAHIFDLISWDADEDGAVELWSADPDLEALYREVASEQGVAIESVDFDSSDHASFIGNGFASVGVSEEFVSGDNNPYYHTPDDSYVNVNFDYLEAVSKFAFTVASRKQ